jgi:hypothetical protein
MTIPWIAQAIHCSPLIVEQWAYAVRRKLKGMDFDYSYSDAVAIISYSNSAETLTLFKEHAPNPEDASLFPVQTTKVKGLLNNEAAEELTIKFNNIYKSYLEEHSSTIRKSVCEGRVYHDENNEYYVYKLSAVIEELKSFGLKFTRPEVEDRLRNFFCASPCQFYIDKYDKAVRAWKQLSINLQ